MASLLAAGCRPAPAPRARPGLDPDILDGARAFAETERFVALGPRVSGTAGGEKAALYLRQRLQEMGIEAELDAFRDPAPGGPVVFRNVLGRLPGASTNWVVLVSHYDTKHGIAPDFAGANDSGSSTGLLLELGRQLRRGCQPPLERQPPSAPACPANILLAFLDGEECRVQYGKHDGLHGSRRWRKPCSKTVADPTIAVIVMVT